MKLETNHKVRKQEGVVVGNIEHKDALTNPIARKLVAGFDRTLMEMIEETSPESVHEVGCGEGRLSKKISDHWNIPVRATDLSEEIIRENIARSEAVTYVCKSVYDLTQSEDAADLVVCCEVLEHVEQPERALQVIRELNAAHYIFSVPREPLWRFMNMCRGKYLIAMGNTPGHLNHWSRRGFIRLLENSGFDVIAVRSPIPWTFLSCVRS